VAGCEVHASALRSSSQSADVHLTAAGSDWSSAPAHGAAMDFTAAVLVEVTLRLARGDGPPGAYTPAAAFGLGHRRGRRWDVLRSPGEFVIETRTRG
jgi:hypothetical protein